MRPPVLGAALLAVWLGVARAQTSSAADDLPNLAAHPVVSSRASTEFASSVSAPEATRIGSVGYAHDGDEESAWLSDTNDEGDAGEGVWLEVDLGKPEQRIADEDKREEFLESFSGQWEGFKVEKLVIKWHGWHVAKAYEVSTSLDGTKWTKQPDASLTDGNMQFGRTDELGGLLTGPDGGSSNPIRYIRVEMLEHATCSSAFFCRRRLAADGGEDSQPTAYGIREIEARGNTPGACSVRRRPRAAPRHATPGTVAAQMRAIRCAPGSLRSASLPPLRGRRRLVLCSGVAPTPRRACNKGMALPRPLRAAARGAAARRLRRAAAGQCSVGKECTGPEIDQTPHRGSALRAEAHPLPLPLILKTPAPIFG